MKTTMQHLFFGCMLFPGGLVQAEDATELRLVVNVSNLAGFDRATITSAEQIVTGIFRRVGIEVAWQHAVSIGNLDAGADAEGRPDVWVNLVPITATRMGANTYAAGLAAMPGDGQPGSRIWVFRPILETVIDNTVFATPQRHPTLLRNVLLAHVIAHEMGHLLLGSAKHSGPGIMTREFDLPAILLACTGGLEFSASESEKIRATVQGMKERGYALAGRP